MKILALDPAKLCGYAYQGDSKIISGTWDLSHRRDESAGMRLIRLESKLTEIAELGIDLLVFEAARHANPRMGGAVVVQAEFQGIIKRFCEVRKIDYSGFSPSEIKKHCTGSGNASKDQVHAAVQKKYGIACKDSNEADAVALLELARSLFDVQEEDLPF